MADALHPRDALLDAVDGRLDPAARADLDRHLAGCATCRSEYEALLWTRAQVRAARQPDEIPAGFDEWLQAAVDPTASAAGANPPRTRDGVYRSRRWWPAVAAGLAAALVVVGWIWWRAPVDAPSLMAADYRAWRSGQLTPGIRSADVAAIEAWFRTAGIVFETRVFDLGMMRYTAVGGAVRHHEGRPSALFAYEGPRGEPLVCQMFEGQTSDLPPPARRLTRNGIEFLVFERDGLTVVFWQEGELICVLTGAGESQSIVDLAIAKAVKI